MPLFSGRLFGCPDDCQGGFPASMGGFSGFSRSTIGEFSALKRRRRRNLKSSDPAGIQKRIGLFNPPIP